MDERNGPQNGSYMSSSWLHQRAEDPLNLLCLLLNESMALLKSLWGLSAQTHRHIRPHGNFILSGVLMIPRHT